MKTLAEVELHFRSVAALTIYAHRLTITPRPPLVYLLPLDHFTSIFTL